MHRILRPRADAAFQLGVSLRKLDQLLNDGAVQAVKIGKRVLITQMELDRIGKSGAGEGVKRHTANPKGATR